MGGRNLIRALHWSGIFVTRLGFYYTQATGWERSFLNKMTSFLELYNSSFLFSSPHLKSHFLPEYSPWKLSRYWQKLFSKFGAAFVACALRDFLIVSCLFVSCSTPKDSINLELKFFKKNKIVSILNMHFYSLPLISKLQSIKWFTYNFIVSRDHWKHRNGIHKL